MLVAADSCEARTASTQNAGAARIGILYTQESA